MSNSKFKPRTSANYNELSYCQHRFRKMGNLKYVYIMLLFQLVYAGRAEAPTPAAGTSVLHRAEVEHVLKEPLYNIK